ncbi:MAG: PHP domain-containing protein [Chlamydiae bacterium]|nr:PHP domain-containing protein [Chlamydiota bacterium]
MHVHSICSDGTHKPVELIDLAKKQNLQGISITDHDTVSAYTKELFEYAKSQDILLLTGVEFSTHDGDCGVHILGYDIDPRHPDILKFCEAHQKRREERNQAILEKLKSKGFAIEQNELEGMGRPHIAKAMIQKGYVRDFKEAFDHYIGDDGPCYVRGEAFTVEETIRIIHAASGQAFLAHPILIEKRGIIERLLKKGFDGIECYYAKSTNDQTRKMLKMAQKYQLKISGGSDFHGDNKPYLPLGAAFVTEENFFPLYNNSKKWINTPF